ncbi:ArfGapHypothetical protein, partial [Rhizoctonia solani]
RFPQGIHIEGAPSALSSAAPAADAEDDFFSSWDKPAAPAAKTAATTAAPAARPPGIGRAPSATQVPLPPTPTATPPTAPAAPRTVTSSSLRSSSSAASPKPGSGPKVSKLGVSKLGATKGGLGAKKAGAPIDFEAAEKKAREEEERIKQLGYDAEREREEAAAKAAAAAAAAKTTAASAPSGGALKPTAGEKTSSADVERLGMGFGRLGFGFGQVAGGPSAPVPAKKYAEVDEVTTARDRFGNQKAISSDMYFGRNDYDPTAQAEASNRLQQFRGATSISSNQYFGREEDASLFSLCAFPLLIMHAFQDLDNAGLSSTSFNNDSLAGIEAAARDALTRVMANPDVQNAAESIRAGALKLGDYLAQMSEQR